MERQTMTAKEAASFIGVSYWLILELAKRKEIPHVKAGKRILFRKEALNGWLSHQEISSLQKSMNEQTSYGTIRKLQS